MSTSNTKISTKNKTSSETKDLSDSDLDQVSGGIGLLLPAVQSAREDRRKEKIKKTTVNTNFTSK